MGVQVQAQVPPTTLTNHRLYYYVGASLFVICSDCAGCSNLHPAGPTPRTKQVPASTCHGLTCSPAPLAAGWVTLRCKPAEIADIAEPRPWKIREETRPRCGHLLPISLGSVFFWRFPKTRS